MLHKKHINHAYYIFMDLSIIFSCGSNRLKTVWHRYINNTMRAPEPFAQYLFILQPIDRWKIEWNTLRVSRCDFYAIFMRNVRISGFVYIGKSDFLIGVIARCMQFHNFSNLNSWLNCFSLFLSWMLLFLHSKFNTPIYVLELWNSCLFGLSKQNLICALRLDTMDNLPKNNGMISTNFHQLEQGIKQCRPISQLDYYPQ